MPQVTVQSWGMFHARSWEESSELVVHTTYTTPNVGGTAFFTRDIVARDLDSTLVPSLRPSVLPQVTETVGVRPTARLADRSEGVPRSHSRSPDGTALSQGVRRPLDIAIPGTSGYTSRAHTPPPAPPPSTIPNISQYLGYDDESLSSDATPPPAQREPPPQYVSRRRFVDRLFRRIVRGRQRNLTRMRWRYHAD